MSVPHALERFVAMPKDPDYPTIVAKSTSAAYRRPIMDTMQTQLDSLDTPLRRRDRAGGNAEKIREKVEAAADAATVPTGRPFTMLMCVEGLETSDGRMFELGSTTWREPPIPFMVQDTSPHGPGQTPAPAWAAGQIETVYRDPDDASRILGAGRLMANDAGQRAEDLIRGAMRGVSIDAYGDGPAGPDVQPTVVDEDGSPISVLIRYSDSVISRVTLVPTPAFAPCCVWLDDEEMPQAAADAHGGLIDADAEPEVVQLPANPFELLVASGGGPLNPPKEGFFTPEANHRQEMILEPDGHFTGHLAGKKECHVAYLDHCEMAPTSKTKPPFVAFHTTEAHCADGSKVACGWIAIDTNHSKLKADGHRDAERWSQEKTWEHYEHSGYLLAKVRASNGKHGIWLSGYLLPGLNDRALAIAQGLSVSGHWNRYTDPRDGRRYDDELLGILGAVREAGYPSTRTRPELLVASGKVIGHIAGSEPEPCDDCDEETEMSAADLERLRRLEHVVGVLVAHAGPEVAAAIAPSEDIAFGEAAASVPAAKAAELANGLVIPAADLSEPLSAAEMARYVAKYDQPARAKATGEGHALRDGTMVIEDADDVEAAVRSWSGSESARQHIIRNAVRLNCAHLTLQPEVTLGKYSADQLRQMQKEGKAMPPSTEGGLPGYPIGDAEDLGNAIRAVGRGAGDHGAIRKHIIRNAKRLNLESKIPDNWNADGTTKAA